MFLKFRKILQPIEDPSFSLKRYSKTKGDKACLATVPDSGIQALDHPDTQDLINRTKGAAMLTYRTEGKRARFKRKEEYYEGQCETVNHSCLYAGR